MNGLYAKYAIFRVEDTTPVEGFSFVLRPEKDPIAWDALWVYSRKSENLKLRMDLQWWLDQHPRPVEATP